MERTDFRKYYEIFEQQHKKRSRKRKTKSTASKYIHPTEAIQATAMEYVERKIDKLLRRVSSKSRRAARRARRVANDSSSGSEFDDISPSLTPKCDRKTLGSRRSLHKLSSYSKLNSLLSNEKIREETLLIKLGVRKNHVSYFHIWFVFSLCHLQKAFLALMRLGNQQSELRSSGSEKSCQNIQLTVSSVSDRHHKTNCSKPIEICKRYAADVQDSPPAQEKYCEPEDVDYVSDYSMYSRPRKSFNELDMSMDESLADSSGRESGYLSGIDLSFINRGSPSSGDSPALSPRGFSFGRERALLAGRPLKLKSSFAERIISDATTETPIQDVKSALHVARPIQTMRSAQQDDDAAVPDYKSTELMVRSSITETKYVTAIFEVTSGGIVGIIDDVLNEFKTWFNAQIGLMGIACEVHWSCPRRHRNRAIEIRMKEALHWSLRENNRRVLNLKNNTGARLPLTLTASTTEENCRTNSQLDCFQGVYRRFYASLLAYQHAETGEWHKPYWSIEKVGKHHQASEPNPQQFIFGSQPTQLDTGSLVALRVTAQNALLPEKIASRLLRVRINDLDDSHPSFAEVDGSLRRIFTINGNGERASEDIALLHADDADGPPYNSIYYYLLPSCSNRDGKFTIDKESGMVTVTDITLIQNEEYNLCAFASAYDLPAAPEIAFDNKNDSMLAFTVEVTSLKADENMKRQPKINFNNNTIITFGEDIYTTISIKIDHIDRSPYIRYLLSSVTFTPSESSSGSAKKVDYFSVDSRSGDVRIDPALVDDAEGVFALHINAMQESLSTSFADLITQVHNVKQSSLLKFVFDQEANLLSLNLDDFQMRLNNALSMDSSTAGISVVVGTPRSHGETIKKRCRSSVCFHALRNNVILGQESAVSALSATLNSDSTLSRLYQAFKVANIEPCSQLERTLSAGIVVSRAVLFWVGLSLLGLLILISFCIYSCFIVRYKDYLNEKKAAMNGSDVCSLPSKQPYQFYKIENIPKIEY